MRQDNDTPASPRPSAMTYRDAWPQAGCPDFISDDSLKRMAEARNSCSRNANQLMGLAIAFVILYILRYVNIGQALSVGSYKLSDVPYGLFVYLTTSILLMTAAYIRISDSWAMDRILNFACFKKSVHSGHLVYASFPNESAWGQQFGQRVSSIRAGGLAGVIKFILLLIFAMTYTAVMVSPIVISLHYLYFRQYEIGPDYPLFRLWWILLLTLACFAVFILMLWARFAKDREG